MEAAELHALVLELVVSRGAFTTWGTLGFGETLMSACTAYKVDLRRVEEKVKADTARAKQPR